MEETIVLLLRIWEVPVSNIGPKRDYPDIFFAVFLIPPREIQK
jgi:hypothetical protein